MDLEQFNQKKSINLNSIWKKLERSGFKFYCVSCHRERHIEAPALAGSPQFYFHVFVATAFLMLITWPLFHWKGVVLAVPVLGIFEGLFRMKMRAVLVCPDCDFDPVLYLVDPKQAAQQVEAVWKRKYAEKGYPYPIRVGGRWIHQPLKPKQSAQSVNTKVNPHTVAQTVAETDTSSILDAEDAFPPDQTSPTQNP